MYRVLFRLVGDAAEAEDLALEVFWRFYRRNSGDARNLLDWLYRVATNLGYNALRARERRQKHELAAGKGALEDAKAFEPEQESERSANRAAVHRVLTRMKPRAEREFERLNRDFEGVE